MARITRTLAVGALALGTATAVAAPAQAHHGPGDEDWHGSHHVAGLVLTDSARAALAANDVKVRAVRSSRTGHHDDVVSLRRGLVFDGASTTTWKRLRINERTNRVTAVVNGDREAVLRFRGTCDGGSMRLRHHHGGSVLRLTGAGAASVDHAAGQDVFDAGDAFAVAAR